MSTWRRKAIALFPELLYDITQRDTTIYTVFFELLPRCRQAHQAGNLPELQKIYGYAEWCLRQKARDISNAAAVAFYEHLGDYPETSAEVNKWLKPDVFAEVASLLEYRMDRNEFIKIKAQFPD